MEGAGSTRSWPVLVVGLGALLAVAGAQRWLGRAEASDAVAGTSVVVLGDGIRTVFLIVAAIGAVLVAMAAVTGRGGGDEPGHRQVRPRSVAGAALGLGLILLIIWLGYQPPSEHRVALPRRTTSSVVHRPIAGGPRGAADRQPEVSPGPAPAMPTWVWVALVVVAVLVLAAAGVVAVVRRRSRSPSGARPPVAGGGGDDPGLAFEPAWARADPELEPDPRRAVVAAYHQLLVEVAGHGLARLRGEAPVEHLQRLRRVWPAAATEAAPLVAAFERAEYSRQVITEADRTAAIDALHHFERVAVTDAAAVADEARADRADRATAP